MTTIFRRLLKITKDYQGGIDDVSIIQQLIGVLFKRLCNYSNGNLNTCENNILFSRVKISCLRAKARLVFHWCLYNKETYYMTKLVQRAHN